MKANISAVGRKLTLGRGATLYSDSTNVINFIADPISTNDLTNSRSSGVIYGRLQGQGILADSEKAMSFNRHYFGNSLRFFNPDYETTLATAGDGTTTVTSLTLNVSGINPSDITCIKLNDITVTDPDENIINIFQTSNTWDNFVLYINSYFMEGGYNHPYIVSLDGNNLKFENMYNTATLKEVELVKFDFDRSEFIAYTVDSEEDINFFEFSKPVAIINNVYEFGDEPQEILKVGEFTTVARDESTVSSVKTEVLTDGSVKLSLIVNNQEEDANENVTEHSAAITLIVAPDGTVTTSAPDPEETANSGEIATARWVRRITAGGVVYKGPFDASAGNYNALRNSYKGWMYVVTTDGVIDGVDWRIGDFLIVDQDGGTAVSKIDNTESDDIVRLDAIQTLTNKTLTSPVLTGTPTAPTAATNDSSTKIATTQLVENKITALKNDNYFVKVGNVNQEVDGDKKWKKPIQRNLQSYTPTSSVESSEFISKNYDASNNKNVANEKTIIRDVTNSVVRLRDSLYNTNINTTVKASLDFVLSDNSKYYLEYITDTGLGLGIAAGDSSNKIPCTSWIKNEIDTAIAAITLVGGLGIDTTNNVISVVDPVIINKATGTGSYIIGGTNIVTGDFRTSVGDGASGGNGATNLGFGSTGGDYSVTVGYNAIATTNHGIQIGEGTNSTANTFSVGFGTTGNYSMLDGTTGKIPNDRLDMDSIPTENSVKPVTSGGIYSSLDTKAEKATTLAGYGITDAANIGLSNLSTDGQMIIDSHNEAISNCILDIPQNLNLELSGNILTTKSGSILTDSGSTYQTITLTTDKTLEISNTANLKRVVIATSSGTLSQATFSSCVSGATDSLAGVPYHIWFDTSNQEVNYYGSDGTTASHRTYPLCIIETDANGVASFAKDSNGNDMIFNGAGFIGHHAFVYPNLDAGLYGNGFNEDGSLKSGKVYQNALSIFEIPTNRINGVICYSDNGLISAHIGDLGYVNTLIEEAWKTQYLIPNNELYIWNPPRNLFQKIKEVNFIKYSTDSNGIVTDFTIRQPVRLATTEMLEDIQSKLVFDNTPTAGSSNPVTSDGIYNAIPNIVSSVSSASTNSEAVGAKLFYDTIGDIATALHNINSGS